jgi:hypothetical protein
MCGVHAHLRRLFGMALSIFSACHSQGGTFIARWNGYRTGGRDFPQSPDPRSSRYQKLGFDKYLHGVLDTHSYTCQQRRIISINHTLNLTCAFYTVYYKPHVFTFPHMRWSIASPSCCDACHGFSVLQIPPICSCCVCDGSCNHSWSIWGVSVLYLSGSIERI